MSEIFHLARLQTRDLQGRQVVLSQSQTVRLPIRTIRQITTAKGQSLSMEGDPRARQPTAWVKKHPRSSVKVREPKYLKSLAVKTGQICSSVTMSHLRQSYSISR